MPINLKYNALGNRRERNLSDVDNQSTALTNLLDGLSGAGTFISEDMDAVRGLQFEKIDSEILQTLANSTVYVTNPINPITVIPSSPLVTLKDRVENAKIITGAIPAYVGGLGPDARFIESQDINVGNINSDGSNIFNFNADQIIEPNYWEYGEFRFSTLLDPTFKNGYGGIQWNGYFSPYLYDDNPAIMYETTGLLIIEYDLNETNTWVKVANIYAQTRPITVTAGSGGNAVTTIQVNNQTRIVGEGDSLVSDPDNIIVGVSPTSITLSSPIVVTNGLVLQFTKSLGETVTRNYFSFPSVEPGKFIKLRISNWYPNNGQPVRNKYFKTDYQGTNFPFYNLYSAKALPAGPEEIRTFLNDAVTPYNNILGQPGTGGSSYRDISVSGSYINDYSPKNTLTGIRSAGPIDISFETGSSLVTCNDNTNIKIGDYIIPTGTTGVALPTRLQVKEKMGTGILIVDQVIQTTGTRQVNFIDYKGLIDWFFASDIGTTVTVTTSTNNIQSNNIVITDSTSSYVRITNVINSISFSVSSALNLTGTEPIYIYSEKGLTDKSKIVFCQDVFGRTLASNAAVGTSLVLTSSAGVAIGQVVQYGSGVIPETPATTVAGITGTTITLSSATTAEIFQGSTIVFSPSTTTVNKEICVIPTDTSPPFVGTNDGLYTVQRGLKSVDSLNEDFVVETSNLVLAVNSAAVSTVTGTQQYDRKIRLNNSQYFLVGKVV